MQDQNINKILEFLEPFGYKHNGNLTEIINQIFPYPKGDKAKLENEKRRINSFLDGLLKADLIEFNRGQLNVLGYDNGWDEQERWMGEHDFLASIGLAGLATLNEKRNRETQHAVSKSIIDTNSSVQTTNTLVQNVSKTQRNLAYVSLIIVAISTLYLILTYYKDDSPALKSIDKQLQLQERLLDSMRKSQKGIDSSLRIVAKKISPKKS